MYVVVSCAVDSQCSVAFSLCLACYSSTVLEIFINILASKT